MKQNTSIQLKAAFLLIVFSLNTMISLACCVGLEICYCNDGDHEGTELMAHEGCPVHHDEAVKDHKSRGACEDDCCNENAVRFSQADKSLPQCVATLNVVSFSALISVFIISMSYILLNHLQAPDILSEVIILPYQTFG